MTETKPDNPAVTAGEALAAGAGAVGVVAAAGWPAAILGVLAALPKLIELGERLQRSIAQGNFQRWMDSLDETVKKLETATTDQERFDAAKALARLTRGA